MNYWKLKSENIGNREKTFNFIRGEEILIYLHLFEGKITLTELKKYKKSIEESIKHIYPKMKRKDRNNKLDQIWINYCDKKFDKYCDWKSYIIDKHKNYKICELEEFYRFLNFRKRKAGIFENDFYSFTIPLCLTILSIYINSFVLFDLANASQMLMSSIVCSVLFVWLTKLITNRLAEIRIEKAFYEDYIELIGEITKVKTRKKKKNSVTY